MAVAPWERLYEAVITEFRGVTTDRHSEHRAIADYFRRWSYESRIRWEHTQIDQLGASPCWARRSPSSHGTRCRIGHDANPQRMADETFAPREPVDLGSCQRPGRGGKEPKRSSHQPPQAFRPKKIRMRSSSS
jgi:hypothetical protein